MTINEKYQFNSKEDMKDFLQHILEKCGNISLLCPSGFLSYLTKDLLEEDRLDSLVRIWFRRGAAFPHFDKMPSLEDIYSALIESGIKFRNLAEEIRDLDVMYSLFSAPFITGCEEAEAREEKRQFFVKDGVLIASMEHWKGRKLVIPEGVTSIASRAFYCDFATMHVVFPRTLEFIEEDAFCFDGNGHYGNLTFFEFLSEKTVLKGRPTDMIESLDIEDQTMIHFIAKEGSMAEKFAREEEYPCYPSLEVAASCFLEMAREYENIRIEAGDFYTTEHYFRKSEIVTEYMLSMNLDVKDTIEQFCRTAFCVHPDIRKIYCTEEQALEYLERYRLFESYLEGKTISWRDASFVIRLILAYKKTYPNYYYIEQALLGLTAKGVGYFLRDLLEEKDYNQSYANMFFGGYEDEYSQFEFLRLAYQLAELFVRNRKKGWEKIWEYAIRISEELDEEELDELFEYDEMKKWLCLL